MNKKLQLVLLFTFLGLTSEIYAQYGYGNGYNRYGRQRSGIPQAETPAKEPEPLTAEELVEKQMPRIIETLELDPFEEAVVRSTLVKYVQKRMELQILKLPPEKMKEEFDKLGKLQDEEMKAGLPEEKFNLYKSLLENPNKTEREAKKKKKRKRKSKDGGSE
ncbi:hypothetical protein GCM10011414_11940 [Croceivirga lutea]|uniref:hypothetical protein n=1 Tax=Croceivirga lutea TaxID=1775167 RepID=UPI00163A5DF9|nr:hypothetical protein [Croceivirga lutea]GGG43916.1 hypothetical protein GCM10011414_11940 [Croceivirga lutea]